ncbi:MAG: hypothetical protein AAFU79_26305, partial [Myxococcota bacterium]
MNSALLLAVSGLAVGAPASPSTPEVHALVVATNRAADGSLAPLRYADDDGARWFELLGLTSRQVDLLTVLDAESQRIHPEAAQHARAPTYAELRASLERIFGRLEAARASGRRTVFYFIYVGHGTVGPDGDGQMHLTDRRFGRRELFEEVIRRSPATVNHVIIDACHAFQMVAKRGEAAESAIDRAVESFLDEESLDRYPNTGVLLATTRSNEVHEWSGFQAGIFSHELRSALAGAGDVDGDGATTYAEAAGFVAAANARLAFAEARLELFARPPAIGLESPVFARHWARDAPRVRVPPRLAGRWWLEDDRGVRYADFHSAAGQNLVLTLVPREAYFLRNEKEQVVLPVRVSRTADASQFRRRRLTLAARGGPARAFREDLFAVPFGAAWMDGYRASQSSLTASAEAPSLDPGWGVRETS